MQQLKRLGLTLVSLALSVAAHAQAQTVTTAPSRITSAFPTGSGPEVVTRLVAEKLAAQWKQPVIVDAKPGGAGVLAINAMKRLAPTGNELVVVDVGNLSINPLVFKNLGYDPEKELVPVALVYKTAFFVTVAASFALGMLVQRVILRPVEKAPVLTNVIVFIGLLVIFNSVAGWVFDHTIK